MKILKNLAFSVLPVILLINPGYGLKEGSYLALQAGGGLLQETFGIDHDMGFSVEAAYGYKVKNHEILSRRLEFSVGYAYNAMENINGKTDAITALVSYYADFDFPSQVTPFFGSGLGVNFVNQNINIARVYRGERHVIAFTLRLMAGVRFNFDNQGLELNFGHTLNSLGDSELYQNNVFSLRYSVSI